MPFCKKCGTKVKEEYLFCLKCGTKQVIIEESPKVVERAEVKEPAKDASRQWLLGGLVGCIIVIVIAIIISSSDSSHSKTYPPSTPDYTPSTPSHYCGDGNCDYDESCSSCSTDCGSCAPSHYCGDSSCDSDEDCSSCPEDCERCKSSLGESCSFDSECESSHCVHNICRSSSAYCGEGYCDYGEDCASCFQDCGKCITLCSENLDCKDNEVCINNKCEKAALTLVFAKRAIHTAKEEEMFENEIKYGVNYFISITPLKNCPEKVRIHKLERVPSCLCNSEYPPSDEERLLCEKKYVSDFDWFTSLSPLNNTLDEDEYCWIGWLSILTDKEGNWDYYPGGIAHELGHGLGLGDEYCYWPNEITSNPVDFDAANCREVTDVNSWYYTHCQGSFTNPVKPYQCDGNPTSTGHCIMGDGTWQKENPLFCEACMKHLTSILKCD